MKKVIFIIFSLQILLFCNENVINGQTAIIKMPKNEAGILKKDKKIIPWLIAPKQNNMFFALIPVNYYTKKNIILSHTQGKKEEQIIINVKDGNYSKESLKVSSKKVTPPQELIDRIKKERDEANKIYSTFNKTRYWNSKFELPLKSKITSKFGNARIFNGIVKSYHGGTDFRADIGTPIKASNDGIVVIAKVRYYAGGSVVIDHGEGIYSCYYHLSKINFKKGQKIKKGEILGLSGKSGRVTGPHLHFGFMVQGVQVDPLDFIKKINKLI